MLTTSSIYVKIFRHWISPHEIEGGFYTERYRSGHNEAVLKTVWGQPHKGSNPFLSAING